MYYFIGIKGTGMASLASILHDMGEEVMGSDLEKHFFPEDQLVARGITMLPFDKNNIKDNMTVIVGNAFADDFEEVAAARNNPTCTVYRYHVFLGKLLESYNSICISGSHGKTTTTGMMSAMLSHFGPCGYLIGDGTGHVEDNSRYFVLEACEYRRHFLAYKPKYAVITNVEIDHVDYYKSEEDYGHAYEEFAQGVSDKIIAFGDDPRARKLHLPQHTVWYGVEDGNDIQAKNIVETPTWMEFDVYAYGEFVRRFHLPFVGRHLLWNALSVITLGLLEGLQPEGIEQGLAGFTGVKRRFVVEEYHGNIYIDDYAHHPTEVSVTLDCAKLRYPGRKIVAVFKPHRVSRVQYFVNEFAEALKKADVVGVCDFTSIDDFEPGIDIDITYLTDRIPNCHIFHETDEEAAMLASEEPCVYVFMSSKDIYPFKEKVKACQSH
ncbi:MAG: UDP-N-acetylmuramate--L-alanine ligase [Erysipelotrichaceae bacterium]|nr:UDP-N-acetylmuramate--L-alanine ligase [Erysipelotrichaceae bacterium]